MAVNVDVNAQLSSAVCGQNVTILEAHARIFIGACYSCGDSSLLEAELAKTQRGRSTPSGRIGRAPQTPDSPTSCYCASSWLRRRGHDALTLFREDFEMRKSSFPSARASAT